tara:strand:+ start:116 stop:277 length:162 start_codon:yes stop_codon:yes gene_type:complete
MLEIRPVTGGPDKLNKKCCGSDFWSEGFFFADRRRFVAKMWPTVLAMPSEAPA